MIAAFNRCGRDVSYREGVDFTRCELAILASGFHGRSGLLRVCLHWLVILAWQSRRLISVAARDYLGSVYTGWQFGRLVSRVAYLRVLQSLEIFESLKSGDQDGHSLFGGLLLSAQAKK